MKNNLYLSKEEEEERLRLLESYNILDSEAEEELDELIEIASAICNTPISLISLVDKDRQWFKAKRGLEARQTPRKDAFCQHTLHEPQKVLVVDDPLNDPRFSKNPLVLGDPNIRFYAGAPLVTPTGSVLGTLCIIDNKPRTVSESQKRALQLLSKRVMDHLDTRKRLKEQEQSIESNAKRLKQLTDQAPGALYQLRLTPDGLLKFDFISKGITRLHPSLNPDQLKKNAETAFSVVHPDDVKFVAESITESAKTLKPLRVTYRVTDKGDDNVEWHEAIANPERLEDGTTIWYGAFIDLTGQVEYEKSLEQFLFSLSHELRRPIGNLLGLTQFDQVSDPNLLKRCFPLIQKSAEEMDAMVKKLNRVYSNRKLKTSADPKLPVAQMKRTEKNILNPN